ncbi:FtsX-like permease family protein [Corynebacterium sp. ES2794-CONJ1]|uniref:ABC transporter permease n=1 Tax=unclassified Corynebacterium TaxID=2624378 RepID=UPI00216B592B|nr:MULTISPECIES: FtsX-like permease family protein [unclassified Corynebacterium]MCS4532614.1 FtsX-like permease family protein [Corynebacterium sp. ES2730-CONJ]MCU9520008.1 FtsX-like permease family protein [Corynebacterium sp. ES2794-CONJ1]
MGKHSAPRPSGSQTLLRMSWRTVVAHKLRLALTVVAVILGTSFVAGSMMFTNSLEKVFDSAVEDLFADVDVVMHPNPGAMVGANLFAPGAGTSGITGIKVDMLSTLRQDPQIAGVTVQGATTVVVADAQRRPFQTRSAQSTISPWYDTEQAVGLGNTLLEGELPRDNGVAINRAAANDYDIAIGDEVIVVDPEGQRSYQITGIYQPASSAVDLSTGVLLLQAEDVYIDTYLGGIFIPAALISGDVKRGSELIDYLQQTYPEYGYASAQELARGISESVADALSFVNYFLVAFAMIALLVGSFIIANTFAMIVAQRLKEFALLRALGCSRRQLTSTVVIESILVGIVGSLLGVLAGMGLVQAIQFTLGRLGMPIAAGTTGLGASAIAFPIVLGIVVTVISAWAPARRAGAVRPVEAMRTTESSTATSLKTRTILGLLLLAAGMALAFAGALVDADSYATKTRAIGVGIGAFAVIGGVFMASPALSIPLVGALGRVIARPFKAIGQLAATNSRRNPKRTATTAFALTLGMALVTAIGMLSASMHDSIEDLVNSEVTADFVLEGPSAMRFPVPTNAYADIQALDSIDQAVAVSYAKVSLDDSPTGLAALRGFPITFMANGDLEDVVGLKNPQGRFDLSQAGTFIARESYAQERGLAIGDTVNIYDQEGQILARAELTGTYGDNRILDDVVLSEATIIDTPAYENDNLAQVLLMGKEGVTQRSLRADLEQAVEKYLVVRVMNAQEYAGAQAGLINQMMYILYALLGLSIIVAVLGIINTLALNVIERRQEIGMLRAVGTHRNQVRLMITIESVQIAIYGSIIGMIVGLGLGWSFLKVLGSQGLETISVPYGTLMIILIGSGLVGVLAAIWPAQRASTTPPLDAISH